jgi:hypothetical protein
MPAARVRRVVETVMTALLVLVEPKRFRRCLGR